MPLEGLTFMSKKLQKRASRLRRKAQTRVLAVGRVVREYRDATTSSAPLDPVWQTGKFREIEIAVGRYNEIYKKLRKINKKSSQQTG
jgi:hypothetical protein